MAVKYDFENPGNPLRLYGLTEIPKQSMSLDILRELIAVNHLQDYQSVDTYFDNLGLGEDFKERWMPVVMSIFFFATRQAVEIAPIIKEIIDDALESDSIIKLEQTRDCIRARYPNHDDYVKALIERDAVRSQQANHANSFGLTLQRYWELLQANPDLIQGQNFD